MLRITENPRQSGLRLSANSRTTSLRTTANPRAVLASVGLVEATLAEALQGSIQNRYMSPLRVAQAIDAEFVAEAVGDLTRVNDTNVTLTLGGTPTDALFNDVSLTLGWIGTLALSKLAVGTSGYALIGNGVSAPSYQGFLQGGTGADTRTWQDKARDIVDMRDWVGSGTGNDDTTDITNAIAQAFTAGVRQLVFQGLEYNISSTILLGNGDVGALSTKNGLSLVGAGAPMVRLKDGGPTSLRQSGTRFKWIGSAGGTMVDISGPCFGNDIRDIALNGNDLAANGLHLTSANRGQFPRITISDFTNNGLVLTTRSIESIGSVTEGLATVGNTFYQLEVDGNDGPTGVVCISLAGYAGSATNGIDSTRNVFHDTYLIVNRVGGTGIRCAFTDQNTFNNITMSGFGTANGAQASVRLVGTNTVPGGFHFPQNIRFTGNVDIGQQLPVVVDESGGTVGGGNEVYGTTLFDQQVVPRWPEIKRVDFSAFENGDFPNGGFRGEGGLTVLERAWRNQLLNARMERATAGTSIVNPGSGQALLDKWFLSFDGSVTVTVSRQRFTTGQDDVPYEPRYFMRIAVSAASGNTFFYVGQQVPSAEVLEGRSTALSAFMKADATRAVGARLEQNFGTGGSPSSLTGTTAATQNLSTSWARFAYEITPPSTAGKTLGSNGDDVVNVLFSLPLNTALTIDIALPQWEAGRIDTASDLRPKWADEPGLWTNPVNVQALAALTMAQGDLFYALTSATMARLAKDTGTSRFLKNSGTSNAPAWAQPAFSDLSGAIAISQMGSTTYTAGLISIKIAAVNFNSANTDNAIAITLPAGFTRYLINTITISHASQTLTTATCGVFTQPGAGGTAIVTSATAITVSTASESTNNNAQQLSINNSATESYTEVTLYFRVQTAQGAAATADVTIRLAPVS